MPKNPNPIDVSVGKRIRLARHLSGISQELLAEGLCISFQQVQKYEKGTNRVGASRLQAIAGILKKPVSFFFESRTTSSDVGQDGMPEEVMEFVSSREGLRIIRSFAKIKNKVTRQRVADLIDQIANGKH